MDPNIHSSYGLKFLISNCRDALKIMPDVMDATLRALVRIGLREMKPIVEVPSLDAEADDPQKQAYEEALDLNKENEDKNEATAKL